MIQSFKIDKSNGILSERMAALNIYDFYSACKFIAKLPYKRNKNKNNLECIFEDNGGTCSTKHAVLRKLALENNHDSVQLMLGIFKMNSAYAPSIKNTLDQYDLEYIPEAHNYLKIKNQYFDFTRPESNYTDFKDRIIIERAIEFNQITHDKISFHREFLKKWLVNENKEYGLEEIWAIREKCIEDLQH